MSDHVCGRRDAASPLLVQCPGSGGAPSEPTNYPAH